MDAWTITFVLAVVIVAVGAQAVVGFGFALIAMPLLVLVLDVRVALVLVTLISLANTSVLAYTHRQHVPWPTVGPMLAGAAAGMPFGLVLLLLAPADVITAAGRGFDGGDGAGAAARGAIPVAEHLRARSGWGRSREH